MTIALVYWIAHRGVVSLLYDGVRGCSVNGHRIVGIRRDGPIVWAPIPLEHLLSDAQLNSISEVARTGHQRRRSSRFPNSSNRAEFLLLRSLSMLLKMFKAIHSSPQRYLPFNLPIFQRPRLRTVTQLPNPMTPAEGPRTRYPKRWILVRQVEDRNDNVSAAA